MKNLRKQLAIVFAAMGIVSVAVAEAPYLLSDGTCGFNTGYRMKGGHSKVELTFSLPTPVGQAQKRFMDTGFGEKVLRSYWYLTGSGNAKLLCGRVEEPFVSKSFNGQIYTSTYPGKIVTVITDLEKSIHSVKTPRVPVTRFTFAESKEKFGGRGKAVAAGVVSSKPLSVFGSFADAACKTFKDVPKAKLYCVKIYEDGIIVHKFVPCMVRGVACLKDVIGGDILYPAKIGAFTIHGDYETFTDAKPAAYNIRYPKNPKPWEITAVNELKEYLARRSAGGKVTVDGNSAVTFYVGDTSFASGAGLLSSTMKEEEWKIRSFGRDVVLNGGGFRGCLYSVYHFLEDFCGVRWWSESEEDVPGPGNLALPKLNASGKPHFVQRSLYRDIFEDLSPPQHAARRRINVNGFIRIPVEFGGEMGYGPPGGSHTLGAYIPWDKYAKDHPEYFSHRKKGSRQNSSDRYQPCLSHPDVKRIILESLFAYIEKSKIDAQTSGCPRPLLFDLTYNDNDNYCECTNCAARAEKYGQSGHYFDFMNSIADKVAEKYPEVLLSVLAYGFTVDPPKVDMRIAPNVMIRLCNLDANFAGAFDEPGKNKSIIDRFLKWREVAGKFAIWDYAITFAMDTMRYPLPNEWYFGDKYRLFADNGVCSIMWEQEYLNLIEMFEIKSYLLTKLNEDPYLDYPALMKKTYSEYFGPEVAPLILATRERVRDAQLRKKAFVGWMPSILRYEYIEDADVKYMTELFDKAEALAAGNAKRLRRVRDVRRGLDELVDRRAKFLVPGELDGKKSWFSDPEVYGRLHRTRGWVVRDPATPTGKALQMGLQPGYASPIQVIYNNVDPAKTLLKKKIVIPEGALQYAWYDIGRVDISQRGIIYIGNDYLVQMYMPKENFPKGKFDIKIYAARTKKGSVRIGRVAFVEAQENAQK